MFFVNNRSGWPPLLKIQKNIKTLLNNSMWLVSYIPSVLKVWTSLIKKLNENIIHYLMKYVVHITVVSSCFKSKCCKTMYTLQLRHRQFAFREKEVKTFVMKWIVRILVCLYALRYLAYTASYFNDAFASYWDVWQEVVTVLS